MTGGGRREAGVSKRPADNRIASAEELDHYIKVTNPSAWAVLAAGLLLVLGIVFWAVVAVVPVTVETTGVMPRNADAGEQLVYCWVDKDTAERIEATKLVAFVDGVEAKEATMGETPMSASEVIGILGKDFFAESIKLDDWNYPVRIVPSDAPRHTDFDLDTTEGAANLVPVTIVTAEVNPITIVLGAKG